MRVLIAFDKFKDSLTAPVACALAATALKTPRPDWTVDLCPLTDGGEGFAEILTLASHGEMLRHQVTGPRGNPVVATIGMVELENIPARARALLNLPSALSHQSKIALIEMATASGLALLSQSERDPWQTTSYGTGELIVQAISHGAEAILLGVGGSATNDLGLGALNAIGLQFENQQNSPIIPPVPASWTDIERITGQIPAAFPPLRIACDVANPLLGPSGAAAIYGQQKGLRDNDLARLESESERLATMLCAHHQKPTQTMSAPGAGAAGGIAFGFMTAANAQLLPGAEFVSAWLDLESHLAEADLVITGEGRFDESSLNGKGPGALAMRALDLGKTVHVFAGQTSPGMSQLANLHLHAITPRAMPLNEALRSAAQLLTTTIDATFSHHA